MIRRISILLLAVNISIFFTVNISQSAYAEEIVQNNSYAIEEDTKDKSENKSFTHQVCAASSTNIGTIDTRKGDSQHEYNYEELCEQYEHMDMKTEEELDNVTGVIDEKLEEELNRNGIFDEEIENNLLEEIENINLDEVERISVEVSYYAINDTEEWEGKKVTEDEMLQLTPEQVDMYMAEKYYNEETDLNDELNEAFEKINDNNMTDKKSFSDKFLEAVGIKPKNVYAVVSRQYSYGGKNSENPTMLKKTAILFQHEVGGDVHVIVNFYWTEMPKYRNLDVAYIILGNCTLDVSMPVSVRRYWTRVVHNTSSHDRRIGTVYENGRTFREDSAQVFTSCGYPLKGNNYSYHTDYIASAVNLYHKPKEDYPYYIYMEYKTEGVSFDFYVEPDYGKKTGLLTLNYSHTKASCDIVSIILGYLDKSFLSATYNLLSGKSTIVSTEMSGAEANVPFTYK